MNDEAEVAKRLSLWQQRQDQGRTVSAADLCEDRPDLMAELERRIQAVRALECLVRDRLDGGSTQDVDSAATVTWAPSELPEVPGYLIVTELGRGGMGIVYKARQRALKRTVALKMIRAGARAGRAELKRFQAETEAVARLQHPNIVQIFEVGECGGMPFCALELVEGGTLGGRLGAGALPPAEAARLLEQVARAMHHAHQKGVLHRDLKPSNVLLTEEGMPKVTDFGLAKLLDDGPGQTRTGEILGTASYMAPEQAEGSLSALGPATDVYALGAIIYECLTGRPPFAEDSLAGTLVQMLTRSPEPPRTRNPAVPAELDAICLRCLQKAPENRYPSAEALADELARFLRGKQTQTGPVAPQARPGPRWRPWAVVAAAVLLAAGGIYALLARRGQDPTPLPEVQPPVRLKGYLDMVVARGPKGEQEYLQLGDPGVLPLQPGRDYARIEARLNRPAYLYLVWVDTAGKASLIHPWDEQRNRRPEDEQPLQELFWPSPQTAAKLGGGPAGTESLLLAREQKLPRNVDIEKLFAGLPPQTSRHRREVAWFEDGFLVRGEKGHGAINFDEERGRPLTSEQVILGDPVLQTQALWRTRLKGKFAYCRAVCFSTAGDR
jgi:serine/threonine protein kinase